MTDPTHRVHGLDTDSATPDWPPLTAAEVEALLAAYPELAGPVDIAWRSPRPLSAAARVRTRGGEVFVKRHHRRVRTPAMLREEHRFIAHLRRHGLPLPALLADATGETAMARGPWTYEVHALAQGLDLYREAISWSPPHHDAHAHTAGIMLARMHRAAADFDAPQRSTHILVARDDLIRAADPCATLAAQLPARPGLAAYLAGRDWRRELTAALLPFHADVQPQWKDAPRLWTHNDWHVSNLCWSDAGADAAITAVLDVGLASPTGALFDLATAIERNAISWLELRRGDDAVHAGIARALIDGYASVQPLSPERRHLLAALLPIVHVEFALSEVEYFQAVTGSAANAEVAWHTFLIGHAAWFRTPPGRTLQEVIAGA